MLADSHCHAWRRWPYDVTVPDADHRGSVESLLWQLDAHDVAHAAVVCARIGGGAGGAGHANPDNNDYVVGAVHRHPDRLTAWVDVDSVWSPTYHTPGAPARLAAELERTGARGITHYCADDDDGWLGSEEGREFFALAARRRVVVSLSAGPRWLPAVLDLALAEPTLVLLLHHLTLPRRDHHREHDVSAALACASAPNVAVKVSGFNYNSRAGWDFPYPEAQRLLARLHAAFGPTRLLWGSDFPASRDQLTYRQSIEVVREHSGLPPRDLALVLGGNLQHLLDTGRLATTADPAGPA